MIEFKNIAKSYDGSNYSVQDLNLIVEDNEFLVLLGSSGSGKSTTLKMINRLIEATSGELIIDGQDVKSLNPVALRRSIGYVFQGIGLFPHMTVCENVAMVPKLLGWPIVKRLERARELLELVGLPYEQYGERLPEQLSGGQQQRVGVARALAADAKYLLMDEPFGALDAVTRDKLQQELLALKSRLGKTIIFVTHDLFEALTLGDRIAIFDQGRMQQIGTAHAVMSAPASDFVRDLFARPAQQLKDFRGLL
ncbi:MAG: ATP-binding cassette domain-containing protein [Cyanobacteria bacterium REEB67]|nr:ATP-binding cassette domain-containing protein [Cyanobacteria bacterium REEB67]